MPTQNTAPSDDGITLVDILVVLLRRRWIILIPTLAAVVLGSGYYFLSLSRLEGQRRTPVPNKVAQMLVLGTSAKTLIDDQGGEKNGPGDFVLRMYNTPGLVARAIRESGLTVIAGRKVERFASDEALVDFVRQRLVENRSASEKVLPDSSKIYETLYKEQVISISLKTGETDKGLQFLRVLNDLVNERLSEYLVESAKGYAATLVSVASQKDAVPQLAQRYAVAVEYLKAPDQPLSFMQVPYAMSSQIDMNSATSSLFKKIVLAIAAIFVLAVAFAFFVDYVASLRRDPDIRKRLADAWGKKK